MARSVICSPSASREAQAARGLIQRWRTDPPAFAREALGTRLWGKQEEIFRALKRRGARVAVRSGHKIGKTKLAAVVCHWFAQLWRGARVIFTGPTHANLQNVIWPEIRRTYLKAPKPLGGRLYDDLGKGLKLPGEREIFGLTVKDPEAFAGLSGENLLFVVDEGSGVQRKIFEAIYGNMAGGASLLVIGNPTQVEGEFYDAFHAKRGNWTTFHIPSTSTPNFFPDQEPIPGLATPDWEKWAREQWGLGSPAYDVRVNGDFPRQGSNSVIPLGLVEDATLEYGVWKFEERKATGPLRIGVDVARFGDDDSVITVMRGNVVLEVVVIHGQDTVQITGAVLEVVGRHRDMTEPPPRVKVDVCGVGAGVFDQLAQHAEKLRAMPVDAGSSPTSQPSVGIGYSQLRDQLWFGVREWLRSGGLLPPDPKLEAELVAPVYKFDARGHYKVEPKDETKKKLNRSPDRADSLALAIYDPPTSDLPPPREGRGRRALAGGTGGF